MALFPGDIGQYTTPDGRSVSLPSGLAINYPGLTPVTPPELATPTLPPPLPVAPAPAPTSQADRSLITQPSQVPSGAPQQSPQRGPVTAPDQDAGPLNNSTPPLTNAQLAQQGNAGVLTQQNAALDQKSAAERSLTQVDAASADRVGKEMVQRDEDQRRMLAERAAQAQQFQQSLDAKMAEYDRNAKAIADTKIDRSADHPILAAIGVALGAIGGAMNQKQYGGPLTNPALDAFYEAIDRKAQGQMQDLENRRNALGVQRDALGLARQTGMDRLAMMDQQRIAALDQASRQIETIKQQSTSDRVRANGDIMQTDIATARANLLEQAATREAAKLQHEADQKRQMQMHRETLGMQQAQLEENKRQFNLGQDEKKRERDMLAKEKEEALKAKYGEQAEKAAKDKRERGVWDPSTGDWMLNPDGKKKLDQADKLEAAARDADPAIASKQREQAQKLRDSAALNDGALAPSKEVAEKLRPIVSSSDSMFADLADAKERLEKDPSAFSRDEWAKIATSLTDAQAKYMAAIGERVSPKAFEAIKGHVIALNPDDIGSRTFSKEKAIASIDQLMTTIKKSVDGELRGSGIKSGWTPSGPPKETEFRGSTSQEIGNDQLPYSSGAAAGSPQVVAAKQLLSEAGPPSETDSPQVVAARQLVKRSESPTGDSTEASRASENAAIGEASNFGLDPKDAAKARSLIVAAKSAGDARRAQIVDSLAQPIMNDDRAGLSGGIVSILRDSDPRLFAEVVARIQTENPARAQELIDIEQARQAVPGGRAGVVSTGEQLRRLAATPPTERSVGLSWRGR